mmetsp:Transcript_108284/g.336566  ORF Transcript_108284/g.336566 Transcript_108284/m.336566 type:complete len:279 (-) Transcript_108284:141-977(-)
MEVLQCLGRCHSFLELRLVLQLHLLQLRLQVGLGRLLLLDRLQVGGSLCRRVRHQLLVVRLRVLFVDLHLRHLLLEVLLQEVHHRHDARRLLALLHVRPEGFRRRRRRLLRPAGGHLHQGGPAHVPGDALPLRDLLLRRRLVELRVVELVQAVRRHLQDLHRCRVSRHRLLVLRVLLLPGRGRVRHLRVQVLDALLQGADLLRQRLDHGLGVGLRLLQVRDGELQRLQLVLRLVEPGLAVRLLLVVRLLLLLQERHHLIHHREDLAEVHLPPAERHHK